MAAGFSFGTTNAFEALAGDGGDNLSSGASKLFTPASGSMGAVIVQNAHDTGKNLYVKWNADAVTLAAGGWDAMLAPGESVTSPYYPYMRIAKVALYGTGNMTNGTDFTCVGVY